MDFIRVFRSSNTFKYVPGASCRVNNVMASPDELFLVHLRPRVEILPHNRPKKHFGALHVLFACLRRYVSKVIALAGKN